LFHQVGDLFELKNYFPYSFANALITRNYKDSHCSIELFVTPRGSRMVEMGKGL